MTIKEIKALLKQGSISSEEMESLKADQRRGVQLAIQSYLNRKKKLAKKESGF